MTAIQMLAELTKSYNVKIWAEKNDGHKRGFRVELFDRESDLAPFGPDSGEMVARYAEPTLERAIARAWAGEPTDG